MSRLALVTAIATAAQDEDLPLLHAACLEQGLHAEIRAWDDPSVAWARYDAVLLRSPWDYTERFDEFSAWCQRVDAQTRLLNPWPVVHWNADKHYLADLAARGVPVVATAFVEPDMDPLPALQEFLLAHPQAEEFVVKPAISAGSRDTQRYARAQEFAAANHIARLLDEGRSAMLQPYLVSVDRDGETALIHFNGAFSHSIRKGAMLQREDALNLRAVERINPRQAGEDERALALHALTATTARLDLEEPLLYARVDLIRDGDGQPQLLELELCEPSLFFAHDPGSAGRFARVLQELLATQADG
ncbi:ATP-grasp domain-containing protein [Pseudomonas sp. CGJS7]|uniref:ATP-grasp domain-containing protein n=1 Tax=Pseudomonas sp. CGJS7 TaxID=3109348 RepID=UPI003008F769